MSEVLLPFTMLYGNEVESLLVTATDARATSGSRTASFERKITSIDFEFREQLGVQVTSNEFGFAHVFHVHPPCLYTLSPRRFPACGVFFVRSLDS